MKSWQKWLIVVAGIVAISNQWVPGYYLHIVGGAVAAVVALISK